MPITLLTLEGNQDTCWWISGKETYHYRQQLHDGGGEWKAELKKWMFSSDPTQLLDQLNADIERRNEAARARRVENAKLAAARRKEWKAQLRELELKKQQWEEFRLSDAGKAEIEMVTAALRDKFWIHTTICWCGADLAWQLYLKAERNLERARASYWNNRCTECHRDFSD